MRGRRRSLVWLAATLPLVGCLYEEDEGGEVRLYPATLRELSALDALEVVIAVTPTSVRAELDYGPAYDSCAVLGTSFRASLAGLPMTTTRGDGDYDLGCTMPTASITWTEPLLDAVLVLEDDSLRITTDLSHEVLERRAELVSHSEWTFARGSDVTYRWTPGSDFEADGEPWVILEPDVYTLRTIDSTESGDLVTFTMPADAAPGAAGLRLSFRGPASSNDPPPCDHAKCIIRYVNTIYRPIVIE